MTNSEIIKLYTSFKDDARGWLALHRQHFTQFVAIILALLGASTAAFVQFGGKVQTPAIFSIGPALSIMLSVLAILVCNKFYKRYAEHDALSYKLYRLLESSSDLKTILKSVKNIYPKQDDFLPERWVTRLNIADTVGEYASGRVWGISSSNFCIMLTFVGLIAASTLLLAIILA